MNKKIKKDELIKIAAHNIEQAKEHLSIVQDLAERDLGGTPKTIKGFRKLLSENLEERIRALDGIINALSGNQKEVRIDADVFGDAKWILKDIGEFISYLKETTKSDASLESPSVLCDSIFHLSKARAKRWNDLVEEWEEVFFNLPLSTISID